MAKKPANVKKFLLDLKYKLQKLWTSEKQNMLKLKETEAKELGFEFDGTINKEDFWYGITIKLLQSRTELTILSLGITTTSLPRMITTWTVPS